MMNPHRIATRSILALLLLLAVAAGAAADEGPRHPGPPGPPGPGGNPLASKLFPPELVMSHQRELGIDARQRSAIMKAIEATQTHILEVQWQLADESAKLAHLLDAPRVNEKKALAQADRVMNLEREIKKSHLGLLIHIKNTLTAAQQHKLEALKRRR